MPRKKLQKFKELTTLSNVAELDKDKLNNFLQPKETILELGCGRGEYTIALAKQFPKKQFIGIDLQGERLWFGAKQALAEKIANVFFLRIQIENLDQYFDSRNIDEIWLTFPDPFPKKSQIKKRLTSPKFLTMYSTLLKPKHLLHLKTDNQELFTYSKTIISKYGKIHSCLEDIYGAKINNPLLNIKTNYEQKYLKDNKPIYYLQFTITI